MALTCEDGSIQFTGSLLTLWDVKELSYRTVCCILKGQQGHCALQFLQKCMLQHIGQSPDCWGLITSMVGNGREMEQTTKQVMLTGCTSFQNITWLFSFSQSARSILVALDLHLYDQTHAHIMDLAGQNNLCNKPFQSNLSFRKPETENLPLSLCPNIHFLPHEVQVPPGQTPEPLQLGHYG